MATLRTVAGPLTVEIPRIKGSRFIAVLDRTPTLSAVDALLVRVRAALPGATHYALAARIDARTERVSDDGEVRGTAGRPILARLVGGDLQQIALVVVRYYGGTKLGKGGLVRAYGEAASAVLAEAEITEEPRRTLHTLRCTYAAARRLTARVSRAGGVVVSEDYGVSVEVVVALPDPPRLLEELLDQPGVSVV